jgi:Ala-tRNA(Pro) deacylase
VEHPEEGRTDVVSRIRGNDLAQAAKALVLVAKTGKKSRDYFLAVIPGDRRLDTDAFKKLSGASFMGFADAARAEELTGCVVGSIPPFSFNPLLQLVVDPVLLASHNEIVFNAGRLDRSIFISTRAYVEVATPRVHRIAASELTR